MGKFLELKGVVWIEELFRKVFWYGFLIFIPSWALANGLLFLLSTDETDLVIFSLSLVELIGITMLVGGLLFGFDFDSYAKKIVIFGVAILLVGYWVVPLAIYLLYPTLIPVNFVKNWFLPPLAVRLIPAAIEIIGTGIILVGVKVNRQGIHPKNSKQPN
ncbi:MAG: hypothetical protein KIH08_07000 [Candidatus Freyarchaeota archaeon]|nr:hypothetical protein [Candidatus Jordarchaeia archaeon]MBS7269382.1 hypothetical protein [Candidatus Jordarchaeia archaeon]MBS7280691.1 hypothetical protein [Candidatus Jordarchaeia archaeon]